MRDRSLESADARERYAAVGVDIQSARINLHASYAESAGKKVERNAQGAEQFKTWTAWAKHVGLGMDLNPTCLPTRW